MPGNIYLSGGGDERQTFLFDKYFFGKIPESARFLYIPIALKRHSAYSRVEGWMSGLLEMHGRNDLRFDIARGLMGVPGLEGYAFIYIGGGNTWDLIDGIRTTGFAAKLARYHERGGIIYGGSAGAIVLGKLISTTSDENYLGIEDLSGLDLLGGHSVACHYRDSQRQLMKNWAIENRSTLLCIPEESGVEVVGWEYRTIGEDSGVIVFGNGGEDDSDSFHKSI